MEKIAIASSDGIHIDLHFGLADGFYIYVAGDDGGIALEQRRTVPPAQAGDGGYDRLEAVAQLLSDVSYVLCSRIGSNAVGTLRRHGITGYAVTGDVQQTLNNYVKRRSLARNISACANTGREDADGCAGCRGGGCF